LVDILDFLPIRAQVSQRMADLEYTGLVWCTQVRQRPSVVNVSHINDSRVRIDCTLGNLATYPGYTACNPVTSSTTPPGLISSKMTRWRCPHAKRVGGPSTCASSLLSARTSTSWTWSSSARSRRYSTSSLQRRSMPSSNAQCRRLRSCQRPSSTTPFCHFSR
jgi:hypothetical protein